MQQSPQYTPDHHAQIVLNHVTISALPSIPQVLTRILEMLQDEDTDMRKLADLMEMDVVISARILQVANSAAFQRGTQVLSVYSGISNLGWDLVKTLTLSIIFQRMLSDYFKSNQQDLASYWYHSLRTAVLCKALAARTSAVSTDEAYISGLLHDIGRLGLLSGFNAQYQAFFAIDESLPNYIESEAARFGIDHCELGAWVIKNWQVKSFLEDAIAYHHLPAAQLEHSPALIKIVYLANLLAQQNIRDKPALAELAERWFNLSETALDEIVSISHRQIDVLAISLNLEAEKPALGMDSAPEAEDIEALLGALGNRAQAPLAPSSNIDDRLMQGVASNALINHMESTLSQQPDEEALLLQLQKLARLICHSKQLMLFVPNETQTTLIGKPLQADQKWVADFILPTQQDVSLIADTWLAQAARHSFEAFRGSKATLPDKQMMRMSNAAGMLCVPMMLKGKPMGVMVLALDQPEFLLLDTQMSIPTALARIAASRLAASGQPADDMLAGEAQKERLRRFVHETSNPLTTVKNYLAILEQRMLKNGMQSDDISIVNEEIDRIGVMIGELYSNGQSYSAASVDINQMVLDLITLHRQTYLEPAGVDVVEALLPNLPEVTTIPYQLRQVLVNLIRNAAEAMPNGGTLTIATHLENRAGEEPMLLIQVSDTGHGIPDEVMARLFSPQTSTKGGNHGGIGLTISNDIIKSLHGSMACRTSPQGTSFDVRLPLQSEASDLALME
jgi:signal transduction histidine kinase/HD-like signal output (HDOD) protein